MSDTDRKYYHMEIAGCSRELPICPISDTMDIAGFVMLGDVEITEHTAKALLEKCPLRRRESRWPTRWPGRDAADMWWPARA